MAFLNERSQVSVTINGKSVTVPPGVHSFDQLAQFLGLPAAKSFTVSDQAARSGTKYTGNHSLPITGGETITST